MKKIFTFLCAVALTATTLHAATEPVWYNDVTSIENGGQYYIYSVNGAGFVQENASKIKKATPANRSVSLWTISKANAGTVRSENGYYLKSYQLSSNTTQKATEDGSSSVYWTAMKNNTYWNIHGYYRFLAINYYAALYYNEDAYDATCNLLGQKETHEEKQYQFYLISQAQYNRQWAIYDFDTYKETLNIEQFKDIVYKDVYAALETAYNKSFEVTNTEHSAEVVNAAKQALEEAYAAAAAYPAKYNTAKQAFDEALASAQAIDKKDVTEAVFAKLHAYDEVTFDVVNSSLETINAATQALKDAAATAAGLKDTYTEALATINALDGLKDKGENADDLKKINDDIAAARETLKNAETKEAIKAAVTAPKLKKIDPVTFNTTTFDALQNVSSAASSAQGQTIHYTSADLTIVNAAMKALHKGTVKLIARTDGNDQYYPFERSATITINAITTYGTASGSVCEGTKFSYEGQEYAAGGHTVTLEGRNHTGGDSIVTLTVTTKPVFNTTDGAAICPSELADFTWEGEHFTENEPVKTKTLTSKQYDCDSTVTFTLTLLTTYNTTDEATICPSELADFTWEGEHFTENELVKTKTLTSKQNGCDSTVTFTLKLFQTYNTTDEITICPAALPYTWEDETFETAGQKTKTLKTIHGCDSTVTFTLKVNDSYEVKDSRSICPSELADFTWEGEHFTENELVKTKTLESVLGCDSIVTFTLTLLPTYNTTDEAVICPSELPYTWTGEDANGTFAVIFNEAGSRDTTLTSVINGCDSTVTFTLTLLPTYNTTDEAVICPSELPYTWTGEDANGTFAVIFDKAGSRDTTLTSVINGCDSTVTFTLTVKETFETTAQAAVCPSELPYTWTGEDANGAFALTFTEAGSRDTILTSVINGCDSTVTFTLTLLPTYTEEQKYTVTYGEIYNIEGQEVKPDAGIYHLTDSLLTVNGCDSVILITVEVLKAEQTIEWTLDTTSLEVENTLRLKAQASSGLPVTYSVSDNLLATIENDMLTALLAGDVTITATQEGNENYLPAEPVEQNLTILAKTALNETEADREGVAKLLRNGHLYIIRGKQTYTADGRKVQ